MPDSPNDQRFKPRHGAIAAGHQLTAEAGARMLQQGGNAVDAAIAAAFVTFIAEYTVSAIGGGGFALVYDAANGRGSLYDFFSATPGLGRDAQPHLHGAQAQVSPAEIDFRRITIDYGPSMQHFHVGRGSVAAPGNIAGLCTLSQQAGRLPLSVVLEPAIGLARRGCRVSDNQHFISLMLEGILLSTPGSAAIFGRNGGNAGLLQPGDLLCMPELAATLEVLGREGSRLFYRGEIAQAIVADQEANGGLLTLTDLQRYRVRRRDPLAINFRGRTVLANPPPSRGGLLISFALRLMEQFRFDAQHHGNVCHLELLAEVMRVTNLVRAELARQDLLPRQQAPRLLGQGTVNRWAETLRSLLAQPVAQRPLDGVIGARPSTTQISVVDEDGLVVSLTTSAGEGAGFVVPGTGVILNNMLGEADLHPLGFHRQPPGQRIPSMMSPTVVLDADGWPELALGSGGANRIRSAILQVLLNSIEFAMPLVEAVEASRIHWEEGVLQVEAGNDPVVVDELERLGYNVNRWRERHMFYGGAHSVAWLPKGALLGHGDTRRGGYALVV